MSGEVLVIVASLAALYTTKKIRSVRAEWVIYALIVLLNVTINVYFFTDPENSLIQVQFLYTIAFSHVIRQQSFFFVSLVCILSSIGFLNIRISTI